MATKKIEIEVTPAEAGRIKSALQSGTPVRVAIGNDSRSANPGSPMSTDARRLLQAAAAKGRARATNPGVPGKPLGVDAQNLLRAAASGGRTPNPRKQVVDGLQITSDNRFHPFKYRYEVPAKVLKSQFDYLDEDEAQDGFFKYRGVWYHTSDFMGATGQLAEAGWDGYSGDSYFSGVVIKLSRDGEEYKVGTYIS